MTRYSLTLILALVAAAPAAAVGVEPESTLPAGAAAPQIVAESGCMLELAGPMRLALGLPEAPTSASVTAIACIAG